MITLKQGMITANVSMFLERHGCVVTVDVRKTQGEIHIIYTLAEDVKPQPALVVKEDGGVTLPRGTDEIAAAALLQFLTRRG